MPKSTRLIVTVDGEKCIGCGRCVEACLTGALQLVNGKSRLIDERRCDGFGSCIAVCPNNAISLELRETEEFDWSILNEITFEKLVNKLERASAPLT
ncbi:MAG: 4Fe-4S dicluster domain-containing protein [Candidatus Bathyarchaeia archaeon]